MWGVQKMSKMLLLCPQVVIGRHQVSIHVSNLSPHYMDTKISICENKCILYRSSCNCASHSQTWLQWNGAGNENIFHSTEPLAGEVCPPNDRKRGGAGQEEVWGWGCLSCECQVTTKWTSYILSWKYAHEWWINFSGSSNSKRGVHAYPPHALGLNSKQPIFHELVCEHLLIRL